MADQYTLDIKARDRASEEIDDVEGELDDLDDTTQKSTKSTSRFADVLSGNLAADALTAVADQAAQAAQALGQMAVDQAAMNKAIVESAEATGTALDQYQGILFTLEKWGLEQKKTNEALSKLSKRAEAAKRGSQGMIESFEALNINVEQLRDKSPAELFKLVGDRIQDTEGDTEAMSGAVSLLGDKLGNVLVQNLRSSDKSMEQLIARQKEFGNTLDDETIQKSAQAGVEVEELQQRAGALARMIGAEMGPALRRASDALSTITETAKDNQETLDAIGLIFETWGAGLQMIAESSAVQVVEDVAAAFNALSPKTKRMMVAALTGGRFGLTAQAMKKVQQERAARAEATQGPAGQAVKDFQMLDESGAFESSPDQPALTPATSSGEASTTSTSGSSVKTDLPMQRVLDLQEKRQNLLDEGNKLQARRTEHMIETAKRAKKIRDIRKDDTVTSREEKKLQQIKIESLKSRRELEEDVAEIKKERVQESLERGPAYGAREKQQMDEDKAVAREAARIEYAKARSVPVEAVGVRDDGSLFVKDSAVTGGGRNVADYEKAKARQARDRARDQSVGAAGEGIGQGAASVSRFVEAQKAAQEQTKLTNKAVSEQIRQYGRLASAVGDFAKAENKAAAAATSLSQVGDVASQFVEGTKKRAGIKAGFEAAAAVAATAAAIASGGAAAHMWAAAAKHATAAGLFGAVAGGAIDPETGGSGGASSSGGGGGAQPSGVQMDPARQRELSAKAFAEKLAAQERQERTVIKVDFGESTHIGNTTGEIERSLRQAVERDGERKLSGTGG